MNVADLMINRYKVIADYPESKYQVGFILTQIAGVTYRVNDSPFPTAINNIDKYPHLFRKLAWYEEGDVKDMPEYVKEDKTGKVYKLLDESQDNRMYGHRSDEMELRIFKYSVGYLGQKYSPASQHDYETFKNGTK